MGGGNAVVRGGRAVAPTPPELQGQQITQEALETISHDKRVQERFDSRGTEGMKKLHSMIGLESVKQEFDDVMTMARFRDARKRAGLPVGDTTLNLVLEGMPGTGKTVAARHLGEALFETGVLPGAGGKPVFNEVSANSVKGQYVGHSAANMKKAFDEANGGVLFVDEANSWMSPDNEFGVEAMETLMKLTEDNRDKVMVILAGYEGLKNGLAGVNPGLPSRFPKTIHFPEYSGKEKSQIGHKLLADEGFTATPAAAKKYGEAMQAMPGQGRDVRNFNQLVQTSMSQRHKKMSPEKQADLKSMTTVTPADVAFAIARYRDEEGEPLIM